MTHEVRLRAEAEGDLAEAGSWYEEQQEGLGQQFLDEALVALESIGAKPMLYPSVGRNTRRAVMRRFPFGVYYRVEESLIVVIAVMHGSRDPKRWKSRALAS